MNLGCRSRELTVLWLCPVLLTPCVFVEESKRQCLALGSPLFSSVLLQPLSFSVPCVKDLSQNTYGSFLLVRRSLCVPRIMEGTEEQCTELAEQLLTFLSLPLTRDFGGLQTHDMH